MQEKATFDEIVQRLAATATIRQIAERMRMTPEEAVRTAIRVISEVHPDKVVGEYLRIAEDHVVTEDELADFANLIVHETHVVRFFDVVELVCGDDNTDLPEDVILSVRKPRQPDKETLFRFQLTAPGERHAVDHRVYYSIEDTQTEYEIVIGKPDHPAQGYRLRVDPHQARVDVLINGVGEFRYHGTEQVAIPYPNQQEYVLALHFLKGGAGS